MCGFFVVSCFFRFFGCCNFVVSIEPQLVVSCYCFEYQGLSFINVSLGKTGRRTHAKLKKTLNDDNGDDDDDDGHDHKEDVKRQKFIAG